MTATSFAAAARAPLPAAINHGVPHEAHGQAHERAHDAHEDDAHDEEPRVAVANVGEFVANDAGQLAVVKQVAQPGGHRHRVAALVYAAREGVELRVVDDVDLGHIHAARHRKVLHNVIDARVLAALQRTGSRGAAYHGGVGEVGNQKPHAHDAHHPGQHLLHLVIDIVPLDGLHRLPVGGVGGDAQGIDDDQEQIDHAQQDAGEEGKQEQALQVVAPLLCVYAYVFHAVSKC